MNRNHPILADFTNECQSYYALFALSVGGLRSQRKHFKNANPGQRVFFGNRDPTKHPATATLLVSDLYRFMKRNGKYVDSLAKSLLVTIYAEWDERYRVRFAKDIGVNKDKVVCPLMGDLRKIRNSIVHAGGCLRTNDIAFEALQWDLEPGDLVVTEDMFAGFIYQVRRFEVVVIPDTGGAI